MPAMKRIKTDYPGVYYIMGTSILGKPERIYYMRYPEVRKSEGHTREWVPVESRALRRSGRASPVRNPLK